MSGAARGARRLSRTFLVTGAATLAGILLLSLGGSGGRGAGVLLLVLFAPVFAVSAVRHLMRGLLWRVGSRLLVSYLLIGVVPLPFLLGLLLAGAYALAGQLAARRAVDALVQKGAVAERRARELAAGREGLEALEKEREELPGLSALVERPGRPAALLGDSPPPAFAHPAALPEGTRSAVAGKGTARVLVACANGPRGAAVVTLPLGQPLLALLSKETGIPVRFVGTHETKGGKEIQIQGEKEQPEVVAASEAALPPAGTGLLRARWIWWIGAAPFDLVDRDSGAKVETGRVVLLVRCALAEEFRRLFAAGALVNREGTSTAAVVLVLMKGLAAVVGIVYVLASLVSALLVMRIARATARLSAGMAAVERGDFSFRARLKGRDQLAALVDGFNAMAEHLGTAVAERAEREALEHELQVARDLQRRLLPPADFAFPGLEIAADFRPAAAIGGDFYHLLPEGESRLSVVIADVSGHGLPTGIVMASAKASLSALAATGLDAPALLAHLDREIRQSTGERTFVTLAHLRFDLVARTVAYTNAGHVYPWVVRADRSVSALENPARPLGVALPGAFRTVTAPLAAGDLWVLVSDGIVEARSPGGEPLGFSRLEEVLAPHAGGTAAELAAAILSAWRAHTGTDEPEDDRTLLVLRVL